MDLCLDLFEGAWLASKCASASATMKLKDFFEPIQLGAGAKGGCEAAVMQPDIYIYIYICIYIYIYIYI